MRRRESRSDALKALNEIKGVKAKIEAWKREAEADKRAAKKAIDDVRENLTQAYEYGNAADAAAAEETRAIDEALREVNAGK